MSLAGATNEDLMTPLHIASLNLHIKIVSVLLRENQVGTYARDIHGPLRGNKCLRRYWCRKSQPCPPGDLEKAFDKWLECSSAWLANGCSSDFADTSFWRPWRIL